MLPLDEAIQNRAGAIQAKIFLQQQIAVLEMCFFNVIFLNKLVTVFSLMATRVSNELILHSKISLYKGHEVRFRSEARGGDTSLTDTLLRLH